MFVETLFVLLSITIHLPLSCQDSAYDLLWDQYQMTWGKNYSKEESQFRRQIWEPEAKRVAIHNLEADMDVPWQFTVQLNKFSDMTASEKDIYRKCAYPPNKSLEVADTNYFQCDRKCFESLPKSVDWRDKNLVTPVKDQGGCGSCWAFSSTGALEGQHKIKSGVLVSLSEQNLVDCSRKQGNKGCEGGWMENAFQYVIDNYGIDTEESYPYRAKNKHCRFIRSGIGTNCTRYVKIPAGSEKHLKAAVALVGPIAVAIDASGDKFMRYKDGIYLYDNCSTRFLNHAVLVVGYGTDHTYGLSTDYWIVKNSWGTYWGKDGYILMGRNYRNLCGIASHATFPVV